jgi:hypothetical protein
MQPETRSKIAAASVRLEQQDPIPNSAVLNRSTCVRFRPAPSPTKQTVCSWLGMHELSNANGKRV